MYIIFVVVGSIFSKDFQILLLEKKMYCLTPKVKEEPDKYALFFNLYVYLFIFISLKGIITETEKESGEAYF